MEVVGQTFLKLLHLHTAKSFVLTRELLPPKFNIFIEDQCQSLSILEWLCHPGKLPSNKILLHAFVHLCEPCNI